MQRSPELQNHLQHRLGMPRHVVRLHLGRSPPQRSQSHLENPLLGLGHSAICTRHVLRPDWPRVCRPVGVASAQRRIKEESHIARYVSPSTGDEHVAL